MSEDRSAGEALLRTGVIVPVRIMEESVTPGEDEGEFALRLALSFDDEESPEQDRADVVEWGALGFLFAIGVVSFADARPRGFSGGEWPRSGSSPTRCAFPISRRRRRCATAPTPMSCRRSTSPSDTSASAAPETHSRGSTATGGIGRRGANSCSRRPTPGWVTRPACGPRAKGARDPVLRRAVPA
jgi:hypothetical protein